MRVMLAGGGVYPIPFHSPSPPPSCLPEWPPLFCGHLATPPLAVVERDLERYLFYIHTPPPPTPGNIGEMDIPHLSWQGAQELL